MFDYMIKTKSAAANYKRIKPYLLAVDHHDGHYKFTSEGYEDLSIENLGYCDHWGNPVYSMTHYYEQNGDLMSDPDMTFSVNDRLGYIMPLTYQQDCFGLYQEVFTNGGKQYSPRLLHELDSFLAKWSTNIINQGFDPAQPYKEQATA